MRVWQMVLAAGLALAASGISAEAKHRANPPTPKPAAPIATGWKVNCSYDSQNQECAMVEDIPDENGRQIDARLQLGRIDGVDTLFITVPFDVLLDAGTALSVDNQKPMVFAFDLCTEAGCVARVRFTDDLAKFFENGTKHRVLVAGLDGKAASIDFSADGFAQAYRRYRETNAAGSEKPVAPPADTKSLLAPYGN
jgi:invasion protein IalB